MGSSAVRGRVFWTTAIVVLAIDAATKYLAVRHLAPHLPYRVVGDVVRFTLAYNPGAAFSVYIGEYSRYFFGAFAVAALFILWRLYRGADPADWPRVLALGLAWGGAAGNLLDRVQRGARGVVDFIDIGVGSTRFWTFNVADSAVTVGAILLALLLWREERDAEADRQLVARAMPLDEPHPDAEVASRPPAPADIPPDDSAVPRA